jgi:hypothetical protein
VRSSSSAGGGDSAQPGVSEIIAKTDRLVQITQQFVFTKGKSNFCGDRMIAQSF